MCIISHVVGNDGEEQAEMGSLLMNVALQLPQLPTDITSSNKRGRKHEVEKGVRNTAKGGNEKISDQGNVTSFGADFQDFFQDTLDKKLPSFFRRNNSVRRDEKRVQELVMKAHNRANTNRDTVVVRLEEKDKERKEALEIAKKQLKKEGKLAKNAAKEWEKERDNLKLELHLGDGKGTKERKRKKAKDDEVGEKLKKDETYDVQRNGFLH